MKPALALFLPLCFVIATSSVSSAQSVFRQTDYTGDLIHENGTRSRLLFDGGYVSLPGNTYHWLLSDHLGSVRVVASASGAAEEYDHYYPLGGPIAQYSSATSQQPLKFQGKEWSTAKSMNLYDFGARRYDPASGRWLSQDPLAEKYYAHSPYLFCAANPMKFMDPTGESIRIKKNTTNALIDLAHIVATKRGAIYISDLIRSLNQYDLNPVPFAFLSRFTGDEIRYVTNPWFSFDGGSPAEFIAMGHELSHAHDHHRLLLRMIDGRATHSTDRTESNAVTFENYLRSVYNMPRLRERYGGKTPGVGDFNPKISRSLGERITSFQQIESDDMGRRLGFKYTTQSNGAESVHYLVVGVNSDGSFYFYMYDTEEQYRNAIDN